MGSTYTFKGSHIVHNLSSPILQVLIDSILIFTCLMFCLLNRSMSRRVQENNLVWLWWLAWWMCTLIQRHPCHVFEPASVVASRGKNLDLISMYQHTLFISYKLKATRLQSVKLWSELLDFDSWGHIYTKNVLK